MVIISNNMSFLDLIFFRDVFPEISATLNNP